MGPLDSSDRCSVFSIFFYKKLYIVNIYARKAYQVLMHLFYFKSSPGNTGTAMFKAVKTEKSGICISCGSALLVLEL